MSIVRVHTDGDTVDIPSKNPSKAAEHIAKNGVWVHANKLYPPSRIVFIEIVDDEKPSN